MPVRDRLLGAGVVLVLVAILGATAVWRVSRDDASTVTAVGPEQTVPSTGPTSSSVPPDQWPAEVLPLVQFVEQTRGAPFDHPVPIEFLSEADYAAAVQDQSSDMTPEDEADLATYEAQLRALGLLGQDTDVEDAIDQLYGEGTLAFYEPEEEVVRVLGTDLDVARRVTLVHELTHAWQDQQGYLEGYEDLEDTEGYVLQTLVEGDAMRVENLYIDTLSASDFDDYRRQSNQQAADVDLSGVPDVLLAAFSSPYVIGRPLVLVLDADGGNATVDDALATPPLAEADLMAPSRWFDGVVPVDVAEPTVPAGAERLDGGPFGATSWLITLSEQLDPRDALDLVDRWAGDNSVVYRQDDRTCVAAAYRGLTPADTDLAASRFGTWADLMDAQGATVEPAGDAVVLRSCEADGDSAVVGRAQLAIEYPALRLDAMAEALDNGATLDQAACFGDHIVDQITVEEMASGVIYDPGRMRELGSAAADACLG